MNHNRRWLLCFLIVALLSGLAVGVNAQSSGVLVLGQPIPNQVPAGGQLNYDYGLNQTSEVTIQALSDTVQPTLTILRNGEVVASRPNTEGALTISLRTLLGPGSYVVQVGTVGGTEGLVIVVLQNEVPIQTTPLTPGVPVTTVVGPQVPLAVFTFNSLSEPAFLYVDGESAEEGVSIHIVNTTTGQTSAQVESDLLGVRFRIKPGANSYQVEIHGGNTPEPFAICYAPINSGACEFGAPVQATAVQIPTLVPTAALACTVSPAVAGGVNIRQSSSTTSLIIGRLPDGQSATVTGISPDRTFYNVIYNNRDGWIAASVVTTSGDCTNVPVVMPPPIIPQPTAIPPTPVPPTAAPPPQPTQPNPPSGPCLITITGEMFVYNAPEAQVEYLYDEVQPGYQLIPTGRLENNSWWQTNYAGAWIATSSFGNTATVSGDCSGLPVVSPPGGDV